MKRRRVVVMLAPLVILTAGAGTGAVSRRLAGRRPDPVPRAIPLSLSAVHRVSVTQGTRQVALTRTHDGTWVVETGPVLGNAALMSNIEDRLFPLLAYRA